jgi:hypothetical protein
MPIIPPMRPPFSPQTLPTTHHPPDTPTSSRSACIPERRSACYHWMPLPTATIEWTTGLPMKCATATAVQSISALPTAWSLPNQNVQPFRDVDEPINYFCNKIAGRNATTWAGKLDKPGTSMGECNQFSSQNNSMVPITQIGYYLSIGLT